MNTNARYDRPQCGASSVEFALCMVLFMGLVMGVLEFGRLGYTYATAVEATRMGARLAVVCDVNDATIKAKMSNLLPLLTANDILITYPGACTPPNCDPVTVTIKAGVDVNLGIPLVSLAIPLPAFKTSLLPESLNSTNNSVCN